MFRNVRVVAIARLDSLRCTLTGNMSVYKAISQHAVLQIAKTAHSLHAASAKTDILSMEDIAP
jgi:hypothetical protein